MTRSTFSIVAAAIAFAASAGATTLRDTPFERAVSLAADGDYVAAADGFDIAARGGQAEAFFNIAVLHAQGLGMPQDYREAYRWAVRAELAGVGRASRLRARLASLLPEGVADQLRDETLAPVRACARHADEDALIGLVSFSATENPREAYRWMVLATALGRTELTRLRDQTARTLEPDAVIDEQNAAQALYAGLCPRGEAIWGGCAMTRAQTWQGPTAQSCLYPQD